MLGGQQDVQAAVRSLCQDCVGWFRYQSMAREQYCQLSSVTHHFGRITALQEQTSVFAVAKPLNNFLRLF